VAPTPGAPRCGAARTYRAVSEPVRRKGIAIDTAADRIGHGPAHFALSDPDGNRILVDQHVASPLPINHEDAKPEASRRGARRPQRRVKRTPS